MNKFLLILIIGLSNLLTSASADTTAIGTPGGSSSGGTGGVTIIAQPSWDNTWQILNGIVPLYGVPGNPTFDFPVGQPYRVGVNYLTRRFTIPSNAKGLIIRYTIDTFGTTPWFDFRTNTNNTCNLPGPNQPPISRARLMIWISPDLSTQTYRYWSQVGVMQLGAGNFILKADFDPNLWTDVYGKSGASNLSSWNYILQYANRAGITFGGGCFYGHGVFIDQGTGNARFTVTSFGTY